MAQGAQTADRALELLVLAAGSEQPVSLADLGEQAGLNKATTYRLVQSLVNGAMLERAPDGHGYVIGGGLVALAGMVMRRVSIGDAARPVLERIAAETSETVGLHVRHLRRRVCIATVESKRPVRRVVPLGENLPLFEGTTGKAIVAFLPEREVAEIVEWAAAEGRDPTAIHEQIRRVRADGVLSAVGDRNPGVGGLSVPVLGAAGVAGAVTVSGPGERFGLEAMAAVAPAVRAACAQLSRALGHAGPFPGEDGSTI